MFCLRHFKTSINSSRYDPVFQDKKEELKISDEDLYGFSRFLSEAIVIVMLWIAQSIFHNKVLAGDDDNYWLNVIDLILMRIAIERMTFMNPNTVFELINSVTPSKSDIDKKFKLFSLISDLYVGFSEHGFDFDEWERVNG